MIVWNRRDRNQPLSTHFGTDEFTCQCKICSPQRLDPELVRQLQIVRDLHGQPITVDEGFRCAARQQWLRNHGYETSKGISAHEMGQAADIKSKDPVHLLECIDKVFNNVGVGKTWFHVDVRPLKEGKYKRRWYYK